MEFPVKLAYNESRICRLFLVVPFLSLFVALSFGRATDFVCHGFEGTSAEAATKYLRADRSTLEDACIDRAIEMIREERYEPAIKTLLTYLDFEKPQPAGVPRNGHVGPTGGVYPAAETLAYFGDRIVPDLKSVIRNDDLNPLTRLNAAFVGFWILNSPATVGFVVKAGHEAVDPAAGRDLLKAAESMAKFCPVSKQEACREALKTH